MVVTVLTIFVTVALSFGCENDAQGTGASVSPTPVEKPQIQMEVIYVAAVNFADASPTDIDEEETPQPQEIRIYDRHGHPVATDYSESGDPEWDVAFDDAGNITQVTRHDSEGQLAWAATMEYDAEGNLAKRTSRFPRPRYEWKDGITYDEYTSVFRYDDQGNWVQLPEPDEEPSVIWRHDPNGNVVEVEWVESPPIPGQTYVRKYTEDGSLLREMLYYVKGGKRMLFSVTNYNENGNEKDSTFYDPYGRSPAEPTAKTTFTYTEFDKHGNWIERVVTDVSLPAGEKIGEDYVQYRELSYYE